jgi:hypothetical protein
MCRRESSSLQRGMNFRRSDGYSVILMSLREGAPYEDRLRDDGLTLIYEGHNAPRSQAAPDPKQLDQPEFGPSHRATQNGMFYAAAMAYKEGGSSPHRVRVYEKIQQGIWSYNGVFELVDAWREKASKRFVFKFKLVALQTDDVESTQGLNEPQRIIPTEVKIEVWSRDKGRCVVCGAKNELHFDHILPFSKGGTSRTAKNIQLLCARHNLSKGSKIL